MRPISRGVLVLLGVFRSPKAGAQPQIQQLNSPHGLSLEFFVLTLGLWVRTKSPFPGPFTHCDFVMSFTELRTKSGQKTHDGWLPPTRGTRGGLRSVMSHQSPFFLRFLLLLSSLVPASLSLPLSFLFSLTRIAHFLSPSLSLYFLRGD